MNSAGRRNSDGFTLLEAVVTIAVVGILAAIALPSYQSYQLRAHRAEGKTCIADAQGRLERYYSRNNSYPKDLNDPELAMDAACSVDGGDAVYTLSVAQPDGQSAVCCYEITATANGTQAKDGDLVLTYDASAVNPEERTTRKRLVDGTDEGW